MEKKNSIPVVMAVGGLDPSGGAGLVADVQTLTQFGCHAATVMTANTIQDTHSVKSFQPQSAQLVREQLEVVFGDLHPSVVKTGMLVNAEIIDALIAVLQKHPQTMLIVDPVLSSNVGESLSEHSLIYALRERLLPLATLVTPNIPELSTLTGVEGDPAAGASKLDKSDCLVTGTHRNTEAVINAYYKKGRLYREWTWPRLAHEYHGSGCTLASAIAAGIAKGQDPETSIDAAQRYVFNSLQSAFSPGGGQHIPCRLQINEKFND
jgi:hydroxymethylpyrimidine/phosphomethylpyrimidine kinase